MEKNGGKKYITASTFCIYGSLEYALACASVKVER
jgi:hypothetical protein